VVPEFIPLRDDTDRYALILERAARVYREDFEGRQQNAVDAQLNQFLTDPSPESSLEEVRKFPTPLRQIKDRNKKVRGLGTWCSGTGYDLFILQVIYHKDDEDDVTPYKHQFAGRGSSLQDKFSEETREVIAAKADEWRERDDVILQTPPGVP